MKEAFMHKVTPVPSCLADSAEASTSLLRKAAPGWQAENEGFRRVRLSAATIGLAISMSAAGLLLTAQNEVALAAGTAAPQSKPLGIPPLEPDSSHLFQPSTTAKESLTSPAIKHEVKAGESIWELSEAYQVKPEAIAASNQIDPQADLEVGQKLKIPSTQEISGQQVAGGKQAESLSPSLENLRETRKRLQESLAALKSEESQVPTSSNPSAIEVSDVSQSSQPPESPQITALSSDSGESQEIELPVQGPDPGTLVGPDRQETAHLDSIPIPVPTPETDGRKSVLNEGKGAEPIPLSAPLSSVKTLPPPKRPEVSHVGTLEPTAASKPGEVQGPALSNPTPPTLNRPIPIPVLSPQTAAVPPLGQQNWGTPTPAPLPLNFPPTETVPTQSRQFYQVRPGDNLNSIARHYGLSASELMRANNLRNPNLIKVDQRLIVPTAKVSQPVRPTPGTIASVPLAASPFPTAQSGLPNPTLPRTAALPESPQSTSGKASPEEAGEAAMAPYTEKLKAEVEQLQQQQPQPQPAAIALAVQPAPADSSAAAPDSIDGEWAKDRQLPGKGEVTPQPPIARPGLPSQTQVVASAPSNVQGYNNNLQLPIGATVSPELPPLSSPNQYLPDAPMQFTGYIWPAKGVLTSGFGRRWGRMHKGVDIAAPIGTPIFAAAPGEVISAGWNSGGYGNLVKLRHADGSITLYAHNSRILVQRGQQVEQGQLISQMGSTGYSTGPHLHFEVHPGGQGAVNPMAFLPQR